MAQAQRRAGRRRNYGLRQSTGQARITSKYQVTIPQEVREDMDTRVGDLLLFVKDGPSNWRILRIPRDPVDALRLAGQGLAGTPDELHREFEQGWQDEYRG